MTGLLRHFAFAGILLSAANSLLAQDASKPADSKRAEQQATAPERVRITDGVTKGELIKRVNPKYPKAARKRHIEGSVVMKGTITKDGVLNDLQVVSGDPLLAQAALDAAKKWKYRPYLKDGQAVDVETQITVNFQLSQ